VRLGFLGGTFDPPHVGHLLVATDAVEALTLDRILFIPAASHPFKVDSVRATPAQRLEMLGLLVGDDPRFEVEPIEAHRAGLSYTVETMEALARRYPDDARFLLIGEDLVEQFATWREPGRIAALAEVVVLSRAGGANGPAGRYPMRRIGTRRVDVSSTEVRARVREGRPIRGFVPDAVADYIQRSGLYR